MQFQSSPFSSFLVEFAHFEGSYSYYISDVFDLLTEELNFLLSRVTAASLTVTKFSYTLLVILLTLVCNDIISSFTYINIDNDGQDI